jgi:hypothetical protein
MKFELSSLPRNSSAEEIISEIRRVDALVSKEQLCAKDFDLHAKVSSSTVRHRFGGWEKALIAAKLNHKYSGRRVSNKMLRQKGKKITNDEILSELKTIANNLRRNYLTQENVNAHSSLISASIAKYRFGSWEKMLMAAGLKNAPGYRGKFSDEEYFENILNVWTHYGRQPKYDEMKKAPSLISSKTYESHFGTWRKALEAFVAKMNADPLEDSVEIQTAPDLITKANTSESLIRITRAECRRQIGLGLRYKVLTRDNFKCVKCGASPARDPTCSLQIDHADPYSKGGKTILENLQTLCEECNLGKSNKYFG